MKTYILGILLFSSHTFTFGNTNSNPKLDSIIIEKFDSLIFALEAFRIYENTFRNRESFDISIFSSNYIDRCIEQINRLQPRIEARDYWKEFGVKFDSLRFKLVSFRPFCTPPLNRDFQFNTKYSSEYNQLINEIKLIKNKFTTKRDTWYHNNLSYKVNKNLSSAITKIDKANYVLFFSNLRTYESKAHLRNIETFSKQIEIRNKETGKKVDWIYDYLRQHHNQFFGVGFTAAQEIQSVDFFQFKSLPKVLAVSKSGKEIIRPSFTFASTYFYNYTEELAVSITGGAYIRKAVGVEFGVIKPNNTNLEFLTRLYYIQNNNIIFSASYDPLRKFGFSVLHSFMK